MLLKNVDFIVFTSEVTKSNHIWKSVFLAAFLRVSFDQLMNTFYVAFNTEKVTHNSQDSEREWLAHLHELNNPVSVKKFQKFCLIFFLEK